MKKRSGLIATKLGASSYYDDSGSSTQVTILKVENCTVSAIKTNDKQEQQPKDEESGDKTI